MISFIGRVEIVAVVFLLLFVSLFMLGYITVLVLAFVVVVFVGLQFALNFILICNMDLVETNEDDY